MIKLTNPTPELIKGLVLGFVSDYQENVEKKEICKVEVIAIGEFGFTVFIWFSINEDGDCDFEYFRIQDQKEYDIQAIRELTMLTLDSIHPYVEQVNI